MEIRELEIDSLVPYENNAKVHDREQIDALKASIGNLGFRIPMLVWFNEENRPEIVSGHGRALAAQELGMETVPCIDVSDLSDAQRRLLTHVDNHIAAMTGFDEDALAYDLDMLADFFSVEDFGFDSAMVDDGLDDEDGEIGVYPVRASISFGSIEAYREAKAALEAIADKAGSTVQVTLI